MLRDWTELDWIRVEQADSREKYMIQTRYCVFESCI